MIITISGMEFCQFNITLVRVRLDSDPIHNIEQQCVELCGNCKDDEASVLRGVPGG